MCSPAPSPTFYHSFSPFFAIEEDALDSICFFFLVVVVVALKKGEAATTSTVSKLISALEFRECFREPLRGGGKRTPRRNRHETV